MIQIERDEETNEVTLSVGEHFIVMDAERAIMFATAIMHFANECKKHEEAD